jgi:hypothetical protein
MKAEEFDSQFDDDLDISDQLDLSKARRPLQEQRRVNIDFPIWMIASLDKEAKKLGVTRQSIVKVWLAERLQAVREQGK